MSKVRIFCQITNVFMLLIALQNVDMIEIWKSHDEITAEAKRELGIDG